MPGPVIAPPSFTVGWYLEKVRPCDGTCDQCKSETHYLHQLVPFLGGQRVDVCARCSDLLTGEPGVAEAVERSAVRRERALLWVVLAQLGLYKVDVDSLVGRPRHIPVEVTVRPAPPTDPERLRRAIEAKGRDGLAVRFGSGEVVLLVSALGRTFRITSNQEFVERAI
jgi:hypothetical protein